VSSKKSARRRAKQLQQMADEQVRKNNNQNNPPQPQSNHPKPKPKPKQANPQPQPPKNIPTAKVVAIRCFEINFQLIDVEVRKTRDIRQWFYQPEGQHRAILDTLRFVVSESERCIKASNRFKMVVDEVKLYEWTLAKPTMDGEIATKKNGLPIFEWHHRKQIVKMPESLTKKQQRQIGYVAATLDKYRPLKIKVEIEEIGQELTNEGAVPLHQDKQKQLALMTAGAL
jgi:hypothetical protein